MLENDDALKIVKTDLANLVVSARRDGAKNAEVKTTAANMFINVNAVPLIVMKCGHIEIRIPFAVPNDIFNAS